MRLLAIAAATLVVALAATPAYAAQRHATPRSADPIRAAYNSIVLDKTTAVSVSKPLAKALIGVQQIGGPPYGDGVAEAFGTKAEGLVIYVPLTGNLRGRIVVAVLIRNDKIAAQKADAAITALVRKNTAKAKGGGPAA